MTDFDRKLIAAANAFRRRDYADVDVLIKIAETATARIELCKIRQELYHLMKETL